MEVSIENTDGPLEELVESEVVVVEHNQLMQSSSSSSPPPPSSDSTQLKPETTELLSALVDYCDLKPSSPSFGEHDVHDGGTIVSVVLLDENAMYSAPEAPTADASTSSTDTGSPEANETLGERTSNGRQTLVAKRRRRSVLTLQQKLEVIRRIKEGEKVTRLAVEYGVGKATVSDLKNQEEKIAAFVSRLAEGGDGGGSTTRKTMRKPQEEFVERALHLWLNRERAKGVLVTGPVLMDMAKTFHRQLYGDSGNKSFKASTGWLHRFKRRNGIKHSRMTPTKTDVEAASETHDEVQTQLDLVRTFVRDKCIDADGVYTVGKMQLHWRALPLRESMNSSSATDSVEVLGCMNATGTHRLRLALIGDGGPDYSIGDDVNLNAMPFRRYRGRTMDANTFAEWFRDEFVTAVSSLSSSARTGHPAALLLVDALSLQGQSTLQTDDGAIRCVVLSSATAFVAQPVCLSLFEELRCSYRKSLVSRVIAVHELRKLGLMTSVAHQSITLKEAGYMLNEAWRAICVEANIGLLWRNTLRYVGVIADDDDDDINDDKINNEQRRGCGSIVTFNVSALNSIVNEACEITAALKDAFADDVNEDRVANWLAMDAANGSIAKDVTVTVDSDDVGSVINGMDSSAKCGLPRDSVSNDVEAHACFVKSLAWLERQPDCDTLDLQTLWKLQNFAACAASRRRK